MVDANYLPVLFLNENLYHQEVIDEITLKNLSIQTYYESMWIERGLNIKYQKFQLPREGELVEPDVWKSHSMVIAVISAVLRKQRNNRLVIS